MIFLYTSVLLLLGVTRFLFRRRAAWLEKKYVRVAKEADRLLRQSSWRDGNSNKPDAYQAAKRQYQLGRLAQKRDRVEAKFTSWQAAADRVGRWSTAVRNWKGRTLPYTFGALDVAGALYLIDTLGVAPYASPRHLVQMVTTYFFN